ncbi:hypothetical protein BDV41DRAFT_573378 [Aspergillus transmontanensis]|uniref:Chitin-binding type-4 domain-containing protein n=1 Tax=Aspergillus transmontanensis TaxID=1034304 RepID=A0A5N6W7Q6_9EURO|nr:hypothetical protein BDV41DRAFT_573378 [Aspergillus transmontanensis]
MIFPVTKLALLAVISGVCGHAVVEDPAPRKTGPAHEAACGSAVVDVLESVSDIAGPIENAVQETDADYKCNAFLCRGYQFEDNTDNVQVLKAGEVLYFHINLIAGHHPGYAVSSCPLPAPLLKFNGLYSRKNVSIVNTATNEIIGEPLRSWDNWPDHLSGPPRDDIDYNVTIPDSLGSTCSQAGNCVIQWYWYASGNEQTYESCHDFYVEP